MNQEELFLKAHGTWDLHDLVTPTGAWKGRLAQDLHHHDPGLAAALAAFLAHQKPNRVIDMGCGLGEYVRAIRARGVACDGFDGHPWTSELTAGTCFCADFADEDLLRRIKAHSYDWCICLEVFEHVPQELERRLIQCLVAGARQGLVISVASPGQGGFGHVNEQSHEYITNALKAEGFEHDVKSQKRLRRYCTLQWFKENLLVFRRRLSEDVDPEISTQLSCPGLPMPANSVESPIVMKSLAPGSRASPRRFPWTWAHALQLCCFEGYWRIWLPHAKHEPRSPCRMEPDDSHTHYSPSTSQQ